MHKKDIKFYQHSHVFHEVKESNARKVSFVIVITLVTMAVEIVSGWIFKSMALLSDGWHMATHASALSITFFAYFLAGRHKNDETYSFGTWKIEILGAYTSSILLGLVGIAIVFSSVKRMLAPVQIRYDQALIVAGAGLLVNIVCAMILNSSDSSEHESHHEHDLNIKSAYLHVVADASTSVFAIAALLGAKFWHLNVLDPLMGILSSGLIFIWAFQLLRETSSILLDRDKNEILIKGIKSLIESDNDTQICDLHLWRVAENKYSCIISLVASRPKELDEYKKLLESINELSHVSIEILPCTCKG